MTLDLTASAAGLLTATATEPATGWVAFEFSVRNPGQDWPAEGNAVFGLAVDGLCTVSIDYAPAIFEIRVRSLLPGAVTFSDWITHLSPLPPVDTLLGPRVRSVPYKDVLGGILTRANYTEAHPPSADTLILLAEMIASQYRYCLETCRAPEAMLTATLTITDGFVPWALIYGADFYEFYTSNPLVPDSEAEPLAVMDKTAEGLWLGTKLTSIWAKYSPRAPTFVYTVVVSETTYDYGRVVYDPATGHMYECLSLNGALGSALADATLWRKMPLLWVFAEPVKLLVLADLQGNSKEERTQAADLRQQAEAALNQIGARIL